MARAYRQGARFDTSPRRSDQPPSWKCNLPDLSIIIATHNRAALAGACLDAVLNQIAGADVEIIVVDSASDASALAQVRDHIHKQKSHHPHTTIKFVALDQPGVAKARNIGAHHANADWIATLDDDAIVQEGWVMGVLDAIAASPDDVAIIQGRIDPRWPTDHSPVIGPRWQRFLSVVQLTGTFDMSENFVCSGANMLLRRTYLLEAGGYDEDFGRVKTSLESGIDTALARAILRSNKRIYFSDRFPVDHVIHPERLDPAWLCHRSRMDGRAEARLLLKSRRPIRLFLQIAKSLGSVSLFSVLLMIARKNNEFLIRREVNRGLLEEVFEIHPPSATGT